eukprot:1138702_1
MRKKSLHLFFILAISAVLISSLFIFNIYTDVEATHRVMSIEETASNLIIGNPLKLPECRNAILHKENIDIIDLLTTRLPIIYKMNATDPSIQNMIQFLLGAHRNRRIPQFWGREQLNALKHNVEWFSGARIHVSYDPFWHFYR